MSKRTVKIDLFQCDYTDKDGDRCDMEGERQQIRQCALCNKDLCSRHFQTLAVSNNNMRYLTYFFCEEHSEEFLNTLINTFGDTSPIEGGGMAK